MNISNAGLQHLRPLRQLTRLILPAKKITAAGIEALHDLKQLQSLTFTEVCDIDDIVFAQLREAIEQPGLKVKRMTSADYQDMLDRRF